jgi:hypothetical protein
MVAYAPLDPAPPRAETPTVPSVKFSTELTGVIIKVYLNSLYAYQSTLLLRWVTRNGAAPEL